MPWLAGQKITAARLSQDSDGVALTDVIPASTGLQDWGEETIGFPNPGVPVKVTALLTGRVLGTSSGTTGTPQIDISFDGGASYSTGNVPQLNPTETASGTNREALAVSHFREGTPTNDIVVRARCNPSATSVTFRSGFLTASVVPD